LQRQHAVQARHDELREKARLLLEKAQRDSVDLKNTQSCDEASHHTQQQQLDSADTSVAESSANARKISISQFHYSYLATICS